MWILASDLKASAILFGMLFLFFLTFILPGLFEIQNLFCKRDLKKTAAIKQSVNK